MADYPYTKVVGNLKKFFVIIQTAGVPSKVTQKTLESFGFKSTNDRSIISILKTLEFVSSDNTPTANWTAFRNKEKAGVILGNCIIKAYSDLFDMYPDAYQKDNEAIRNFFSANTSVGEQAIGAMVNTFKSLCEMATFDKLDVQNNPLPTNEASEISATVNTDQGTPTYNKNIPLQVKSNGLALNINIELHLPATQDGEIYDKLFEALKRHLLQG